MTISAAVEPGFRFLRWSEGGVELSPGASHTFVIDRDRSMIAEAALELTVTATTHPTTGGTVQGGGVFLHGEEATVLAEPSPGHLFQG